MEEAGDHQSFDLKLSGPGISVERSIDEEKAREILQILLGGTSVSRVASIGHIRTAADPRGGNDVLPRAQPRVSLREFMEEAEARRNPDKIVIIGEYLVETEGKEDFGKDEVKGYFRIAGEPVPANYPRDFAWTIQSGWIAQDPNKQGRFYVTRKGKDAIAQKFASEVRRSLSQTPVGRRRARRLGGSGPVDA